MTNYMNEKGQIALISILIITAAVLIIAVSASYLTIGALKISSGFSLSSFYMSEACVDGALKLLQKDAYTTAGSVPIGSGQCSFVVNSDDPPTIHTIEATANSNNNVRKIKVIVSRVGTHSLSLVSWEEIP